LGSGITLSYTGGRKTAVSVPDDLFERADRLAQKSEMTRSGLFSAALRDFVARHTDDDVTGAMDAALLEIDDRSDPFIREASIRVLERTEC
jgi:metal-responsive CopG/Arc/MetJ family transcriptional regulator